MEADRPARLSIPAARFPRILIAALLVLIVFGAMLARVARGAEAETPIVLASGVCLGLLLWSIVALPWLVPRATLGVTIEVTRRRLVVRPRFWFRWTIPLAPATCVVFRRMVLRDDERWAIEVVTGASERALEPLLLHPEASTDDAVRFEVGTWGFLGAPAARSAAEWIARRLRAPLLDTTGSLPVRLRPEQLDATLVERLRRAPALAIREEERPPEFDVDDNPNARTVSWRTPESKIFWVGAWLVALSLATWFVVAREGTLDAERFGLPSTEGLLLLLTGFVLMWGPLRSRVRLIVGPESLTREASVFGLRYSVAVLPTSRIEDVTWQVPCNAPSLPPARRVVIVTDDGWSWVYVRNEASARWLAGWLQRALLAAHASTRPDPRAV